MKREATMGLTRAVNDVQDERFRQVRQWGGPDHDDEHEAIDWLHLIFKQLKAGEKEWAARRQKEGRDNADMRVGVFEVRDRLIKIAALAIAGIESIDRKGPDQ
jgi:hypothetical protein